jgi:hypothetical protein
VVGGKSVSTPRPISLSHLTECMLSFTSQQRPDRSDTFNYSLRECETTGFYEQAFSAALSAEHTSPNLFKFLAS